MYRCRVERDSVSPMDSRLITFVVEYPRCVLAEVVTHRMNSDTWNTDTSLCDRVFTEEMSKNSASSRAIPVDKVIQKVKEDPYMPTWTVNCKGMQGEAVTDKYIKHVADETWLEERNHAIATAEYLAKRGIHKQDCNRLLEPWMWTVQVITATELALNNFYTLRCHKDAAPAFQKIARMMYLAQINSQPKELADGQWHLPFVPLEEQDKFVCQYSQIHDVFLNKYNPLPDLIKFSAARCAWVSYENHDRDSSPEAMLRTFDRLVSGDIVHASPLEHQATPIDLTTLYLMPSYRSNAFGWLQARKLVPREKATKFEPSAEEIASWDLS